MEHKKLQIAYIFNVESGYLVFRLLF